MCNLYQDQIDWSNNKPAQNTVCFEERTNTNVRKVPSKILNKMKICATGKVAMLLLILVLVIGCEKANNSKYTPPSDHTVSKDGFMHKSGLEQPIANCADCHGSDLKGGTTGVSCFECHDKEW